MPKQLPTPSATPTSSPARGRPRKNQRRFSGVKKLENANEQAISTLLHDLLPQPTVTVQPCGHSVKHLNLCYGRKPDSTPNMGRWYSIVRPFSRLHYVL